MLDPSFFVGFDVVPFSLEFVSECPQELPLNSVIEDVPSAIAESLYISIAEVVRIGGALAILDHCTITFTVGTNRARSSIEVDIVRLGQVTVGTLDPTALELVGGVTVIEATEPESTYISCKRPLANPDVVFHILDIFRIQSLAVGITVLTNVAASLIPSHVSVGVKNDILDVIICKQIVPDVGFREECVMENEFHSWVNLLDFFSN